MKRILSTLAQKWPEYLLEILVLIIGIYGAFALESWNEERNESNQEQLILLQLQNEYQQNLQQLDQKIELRNFILMNCVKILDMINEPESASKDSLLSSLRYLMLTPTFDPISSDVIISGNIRLVSNPRLKQLLQHWSSEVIQVQEEERKWDKIASEQLLPVFHEYGLGRFIATSVNVNNADLQKVRELILIDSTNHKVVVRIPKPTRELDMISLLENPHFDGLVTAGIQFNRVANSQSFILRDKIVEILSIIENDLEE